MTCYHPMPAVRLKNNNGRPGKFKFIPRGDNSSVFPPFEKKMLPCGQCLSCRISKSREWAIRCVHEASKWDLNCFITLTYNNEYLPKDKSLNKKDFQLFMKRLRKRFGDNIRFFECGEYGELNERPHYHACLFNFDFDDKELWKVKGKTKLYRSKSLEKLWPFGFSTIGEVTFESAAYVARYITKKITGLAADDHYQGRLPEFTNMSRRPGVGRDWYEKNKADVYRNDFVLLNRSIKLHPPRYYDKLYEGENPEEFEEVKRRRAEKNEKKPVDRKKLSINEQYKKRQYKQFIRDYEMEK